MDLFGIGNLVSNALNTGISQATNKKNFEEAKRQYEENMAFQKEQFQYQKDLNDYQKQLNDIQMKREDTAVQRKIQDLQQAGLNPLSADATGGAATSGGQAGSSTSFTGTEAAQMGEMKDLQMQVEADSLYNLMSAKGNLAQQQAQTDLLNQQKLESESRVANTTEDTNLKKKQQEEINSKMNVNDAHINNLNANTWNTEESALTENYNRQYSQGRNLRTTDNQGNISIKTPLISGSVDRTFLDSINPASPILNKMGIIIGNNINKHLDRFGLGNEFNKSYEKYKQMRGW